MERQAIEERGKTQIVNENKFTKKKDNLQKKQFTKKRVRWD